MNVHLAALPSFVACFLVCATDSRAEPVAVRSAELGQGMTFSHADNCYLITARHVIAGKERAQVIAEGAVTGTASLLTPFWDGFDVAIGTVRQGAAEDCSVPSSELTADPPKVSTNGTGELVIVSAEGLVQRLPMLVIASRYREFDAQFIEPETVVQQGMSGAFLFQGNRMLGMARASQDAQTITFIRMEEIGMNVGRWLLSQDGQFSVDGGDGSSTVALPAGRPIELIGTSVPALGPDVLAETMLTGQTPFVFQPNGPVTVTIRLLGEQPATLSRVSITSTPSSSTALPRAITILSSPDSEGENWDSFHRGEMGSDGLYDTGLKATRNAERIRLIVRSAWGDGPVEIGRVVVQ